MDYEKAYKAVLQTATQWIKDGCTDKEKICLECVFPELRESEDERIRKGLVKLLTVASEAYLVESTGIKKDSYLAYLEKQEQKPVECIEDSVKFEEGFKVGRESGLRDGQKYVLNNLDSYGLCKPAWSDEDEQIVNWLYDMLKRGIENAPKGCPDNPIAEKALAWLEKQKEHVPENEESGTRKEQKPAWSEEDEKMLNRIIETLSLPPIYDTKACAKMVSWLKSLRPCPSWKPSEEQMEALAYASQVLGSDLSPRAAKASEELESLREQLKRLMQL